jgi:AcrR family transcriptional regulator
MRCVGRTSLRKRDSRDGRRAPDARERILQTAYELFTRHGIRAVGVDTIVARSGVAKMTLYRHYPSKDELALEFLRRRREFSLGWQAEVASRNLSPGESLLAVFDALDKWYRHPDYAGCPVVKTVLEIEEAGHPLRAAAEEHFAAVRHFLQQLAEQAGVPDPQHIARVWHMLILGSIVAACAGDLQAAPRAKEAARAILAQQGGARRRGKRKS